MKYEAPHFQLVRICLLQIYHSTNVTRHKQQDRTVLKSGALIMEAKKTHHQTIEFQKKELPSFFQNKMSHLPPPQKKKQATDFKINIF